MRNLFRIALAVVAIGGLGVATAVSVREPVAAASTCDDCEPNYVQCQQDCADFNPTATCFRICASGFRLCNRYCE